MENIFDFADELGPIKIVHVYDPKCGLRGIVAIDNIARGPSIGGVRMAPDVSVEEAFRLARAMTLKNSAANLPHGGGKSVIFGDPKMDPAKKELLIRAFARAIRNLVEYIPGPDMGTDERCMAWIKNEIGRAVGLPPEIGGIPLDEIGATGLGLRAAVEAAIKYCNFELKGARHPLLRTPSVVPVDISLQPPVHVLVITGPNTGGMGAYSPVPWLADADALVERFDVSRVRVRVRKPEVRLDAPAAFSAATIERSRR